MTDLGAALAALDPAFTGWLDHEDATVEQLPAPFLRRYRLYRIVRRLPHRPVGACVAWAPSEPAYMLTGQPDQFVAAAIADGVALEQPAVATEYAVALLETTAPQGELVYVLRRAADVRFHERLDAAEGERVRDFVATYSERIKPPAARSAGDGWRVELHAMRQRTLERITVALTSFGSAEVTVTPLERDLPAAFATDA